jgi:Rrf2 family protein
MDGAALTSYEFRHRIVKRRKSSVGSLGNPNDQAKARRRLARGKTQGMLTNKGKYGLKAMVHLAGLPPGQPALVADVAAANAIPKKFLDAILGELRTAGLVHSKKGRGGGYVLAKSPIDIMVGEIVRALDGPLAPIACASRNFYRRCDDCIFEGNCSVRLMMIEVRDATALVLDNRSLAAMRALTETADVELNYDI